MWRQLSEASTPVDYPTNHQSFCNSWEDESACWITSRACWCLFFYSPSRAAPGWGPNPSSRHPLCAISRPGPHPSSDWHRRRSEAFWRLKGEQLQAQMVFLYIGQSVCLSVMRQMQLLCICFVLWTLARTCRDTPGGCTTSFNIQGDVCMHATCSYVKTQMHNQVLNHRMCIYANTNIYACLTMKKRHLLLRYRETLPHRSCRRTVHTYCIWSLTQCHPHSHPQHSHMSSVRSIHSIRRGPWNAPHTC